jgi:hypothetical protein
MLTVRSTEDVLSVSCTLALTNEKGLCVCFDDPKFVVSDRLIRLLYDVTRAARTNKAETIVVGQIFDDASKVHDDVFRIVVNMISSFPNVRLSRPNFTHYQLSSLLSSLTASLVTKNVELENIQLHIASDLCARIKTSSGTVSVVNDGFLQGIYALIADRVPFDVWTSGWVFQTAQAMVLDVVDNTFYVPVPVEVGLRMLLRACAFILDQNGPSILELAVERSANDKDTVVDHTKFRHVCVAERETMDIRTCTDVRTWTDSAILPFAFAYLVSVKNVYGSNIDDLLMWALMSCRPR